MSEREPGPQPDDQTVKVTVRSLKNLGDECEGLKKKLSEARSVLRQLEWSARYSQHTGWPCCPACRGLQFNSGHKPNCDLNKALRGGGE